MKRVKIELEFLFRASPAILYQFFSTPSCLIRWFCDEVDINDNVFSFVWDGFPEYAELIDHVEDEMVRFRWEEAENKEEFLEFKMTKSPVTGETILEIIDYCDEDEEPEQKLLWESQVKRLRQETGG